MALNEKDKTRLDQLFQYSLFESLAHRRTRRFGLRYGIDDKCFEFKSEKKPVPLTELENAILVWAADGVNGLSLGEGQTSTNVMQCWNGRTHANACNDQNTNFLIMDDSGVYMHKPKDATKIVEFETPEDREKFVTFYRQNTTKIMDERPTFPPQAFLQSNQWFAHTGGSTWFFPLVDLTSEYINFLLYGLDRDRYQLIDANTGKGAGKKIQQAIDDGYLNGPQVPLQMMDIFVYNVCVGACYLKIQNVSLAAEAMGVGHFLWAGYTPVIMLGGTPFCKGFGFYFVQGKDGVPNPVGLKGHLEALCPPFYENMDAAVDDIVAKKYGPDGCLTCNFNGLTPLRDFDCIAENVAKHDERAGELTKDYCNYVYETYGRFPPGVDSIQMPVSIILHHLDLDFYDKYYPPEVITHAHRDHMKVWHD
jgi:hypothetical protein